MYVHAGTYRDDDMLSPGEVSTPLEWILHYPASESFAFRVRLSSQQSTAIAGIVFEDHNGNGRRDPEDPVRVDAGRAEIAGARVTIDARAKPTARSYGHMAIHPYPVEMMADVTLADGRHLRVRPIRPEDAEMERAFVNGLSEAPLSARRRAGHYEDDLRGELGGKL